jgi:hypothetical protein
LVISSVGGSRPLRAGTPRHRHGRAGARDGGVDEVVAVGVRRASGGMGCSTVLLPWLFAATPSAWRVSGSVLSALSMRRGHRHGLTLWAGGLEGEQRRGERRRGDAATRAPTEDTRCPPQKATTACPPADRTDDGPPQEVLGRLAAQFSAEALEEALEAWTRMSSRAGRPAHAPGGPGARRGPGCRATRAIGLPAGEGAAERSGRCARAGLPTPVHSPGCPPEPMG